MEHLPLEPLAHVLMFLTSKDALQLSMTCHALQPQEETFQKAIGLLIKCRFGDVCGFLREDDAHWPRSLVLLRSAEFLRVKKLLLSAEQFDQMPRQVASDNHNAVLVSRAWLLAFKRHCQPYEQFLLQFRDTKKKRRERENKKSQQPFQSPKQLVGGTSLRNVAALIQCAHGDLLPSSSCVGRLKRVLLPRNVGEQLHLYFSAVISFRADQMDCFRCVADQLEQEKTNELRTQERFEQCIAGSNELLDVFLRKNGYPKELFSPASTPGDSLLTLSNESNGAYFLVPRKWLMKWRQYVKNLINDSPGPILTAELICYAHQRPIIPPYITLFLSGFSLEHSLRATQGVFKDSTVQYEIVTHSEWEQLSDRYCAEYAVGFDVFDGSYHWRTSECSICHYGMAQTQARRCPNSNR